MLGLNNYGLSCIHTIQSGRCVYGNLGALRGSIAVLFGCTLHLEDETRIKKHCPLIVP